MWTRPSVNKACLKAVGRYLLNFNKTISHWEKDVKVQIVKDVGQTSIKSAI